MDYREFCQQFTSEIPAAHAVGERYYLVGEDLKGFRSGEQRKAHAMGLYLGMGRRFVPSAALLTLLAKTSERKARVKDDKAEWLFLCGRDLFGEAFQSAMKEGLVLVQNTRDENLGLGFIKPDERHGTLLVNVLDRGNYLRHERVTLPQDK